jgi:hypothetical protein
MIEFHINAIIRIEFTDTYTVLKGFLSFVFYLIYISTKLVLPV